jgi:hypothetical protein
MAHVKTARKARYSNDIAALIPEFWAQESLAILEENMVIGNLVHRDFSNEVAKFGQVVHTRKPGELTAKRKWHSDSVTIQDVTSTDVAVKLNQHVHISFLIKDGEESLAMKDLVQLYMYPAMLGNARFVDRVLLGQYVQFLSNRAGKIGGFTGQSVKDYIIDTRTVLNNNKAYEEGRNLILTTNTEAAALKPEFFTSAEKVGDQGTALRTASLGQKFGFNFFMSQNAPSVGGAFTTTAGAVNNAAGYPVGTKVLTVDGITGAWANGNWVKIDGVPYQITAHSETMGNTTSITLNYGLLRAVADNDVITRYSAGQVNNAAGYAVGWYTDIAYDTFTGTTPRIGQSVSFGTDTTNKYTVVDTNGTTTILLDRPLEAALVDNDAINITPEGEFNFAFHRNALAMVSRPLALPMAGAGAQSAIASYNGMAMRATIAYLAEKQGHLVTLDFLFGVKVLEPLLGAVLLA